MKMFRAILGWVCGIFLVNGLCAAQSFRPPAAPLVTSDPYFSVWSFANRLTDDTTRHWTGVKQSLESMVRVDGKPYRIMGDEPSDVPAMPQVSLQVLPTRTLYQFKGAGVQVNLTFMTPLLPGNLNVFSRPVTYLTWEVRSTNRRRHAVSLYFSASSALAVNTTDEQVVWSRPSVRGLTALRVGTEKQPVLKRSGDNVRIDWGYFYAATPRDVTVHAVVAGASAARQAFAGRGQLPAYDTRMPRAVRDDTPVTAFTLDLRQVGSRPIRRHVTLAYDEIYSIEYFHQRLRPYWRRNGADAAGLLRMAEHDYGALTAKCEAFDRELETDLTRVGGSKYAQLAALAYRQSFAAQKLVDGPDGQPFFFPKENFSNGCISTVDVIYPTSPILLLLNPSLLKASLVPLLKYAESNRWHFPFAPHDLGTYPLANGQVYGGGATSEKDQMPVEESGNMLLMIAAISKIEGNADLAAAYWPLLEKWAAYLKKEGLDPANQLSTDDFAGHLAHNANLSLKAIEALDAFAKLCELRGLKAQAQVYDHTAHDFAAKWITMAKDGDHYKLAFDKPGTWSQKYNLVWNKILGLHLFPDQVADTETAFYLTKENRFGFPLDNRKAYTKLDWEFWSATLSPTQSRLEKLIAPIYNWANETTSRVPLTDWYWTDSGKKAGFQARSVVGGLYVKMIADPAMWTKWAHRTSAK
jgi:Glutaminase A six helical-hairpin domain/Domain of unknown function (DUF5127)/Domain of unknown function (DUF4964)